MPPLDEGSLFYMPTTMPGISVTEAQKLLQVTDRIIKLSRKWTRSWARPGGPKPPPTRRPSPCWKPLSPSSPKSQWRKVDTWYSSWAPEWLKTLLRRISPDHHLYGTNWSARLNEALKLPGLSNAWTMPIKGRIDMLTTGIRTPVGLKISGADLVQIEQIGGQVEAPLRQVKGTRERFCRADRRRLFPRYRLEPR